MAMVDLASSLPSIQQRSLDSPFNTMDGRTIDLNQHAFDLNELPSNDTALDSHEGLSSQDLVRSLIPRKGGWLELFCNMFGQDKVVLGSAPFGSCSTISDFTRLNSASVTDIKPYIDPRLHGNGVLNNDQGRQRTINGCGFCDDENLCHEQPPQSTAQEYLPFGVGRPKCATLSVPSPQLNRHTADVSLWDLNSHPVPQQNKEIAFTVSTKASCMASSSSYPELRYGARKSMRDLLVCVMNNPGQSTQLYDVLRTNSGQDSGLSEQEKRGVVASSDEMERGNKLMFLKGKGASSGTSTSRESEYSQDPQSLPAKDEKMEEPRIRIVPSPDWLPAGWITEVKTRKAGSTAGTTDKYYKDPVTGRRCRSKNEVMNFLRTGRLGRNKPQIRLLEGLADMTTTMPLLLPLQEHNSGELNNSHAVGLKQTFLPQIPGVPMCSCSQGLVLSGGQEQEKLVSYSAMLESGGHEVQDAGICMEGCKGFRLQRRSLATTTLAQRTDLSQNHGCSNVEIPGHSGKRKFLPDPALGVLSKRLCHPVVPRQGIGYLCTHSFSRTGELPVNLGPGIPPFAGLSPIQAPGLHTGHPFKQEETISEALIQPLVSNARALGFCPTVFSNSASQLDVDCINELRLRTGSMSKNVENRFPRLTLKQERELLLLLGRKLCQQFVVAAAKVEGKE